MFYFLPILGGQKVAMFDSAKGWCVALGLFPSHYLLIYVLFPSHSLGGQKVAVSDSAQGWAQPTTSELPGCRSAGTMGTDGQRTNGKDDHPRIL